MPKRPFVHYECPRCGYKTEQKVHMRKHLFIKKKPCPNMYNIELTDEIKNIILSERIYHVPNKNKEIVQNINVNNTFVQNNATIVANMDDVKKLDILHQHMKTMIKPLEMSVWEKYNEIDMNYDTDDKGMQTLQHKDFYNIIKNVTKWSSKNFDDLNIICNSSKNTILIYDKENERLGESDSNNNPTWIESDIPTAVKRIICRLQDYPLDSYERYLIRKIVNDKRADLTNKLQEYYRFIATLNLMPYACKDNIDKRVDDRQLLEDNYRRGTTYIYQFYNMFLDIKREVTDMQRSMLFDIINDTIKGINEENISKLNQTIIDLIGMDEEFRSKLYEIKQI